MIINEGIKAVIEGSAFISLVTVGVDGAPHPIIAGKGTVDGDTILFGIYKMETTQQNLASNKNAWVLAATKEGGPKGYRLTGTAEVKEKQLIFTPSKAEALI
jgi:uncharacterized protein